MRRSSYLSSRKNNGFTLLELMLAIAISAIVILTVNFAFFQSNKNIEAVRTQREAYETVRIVMDRMIKDLTCTYVPTEERQMTVNEFSMYRFVGTKSADDSNGVEMDSIYFTTTTDIGFSKVPGGVCEVDYYLKETEDQKGVYSLMRREDPTPHYGITKAGNEMEIAEDVLGMNIVYIDNSNQEVNEWDLTQKLSLPKQVKVTLTMKEGKEKVNFSMTASLPLSGITLNLPQG